MKQAIIIKIYRAVHAIQRLQAPLYECAKCLFFDLSELPILGVPILLEILKEMEICVVPSKNYIQYKKIL